MNPARAFLPPRPDLAIPTQPYYSNDSRPQNMLQAARRANEDEHPGPRRCFKPRGQPRLGGRSRLACDPIGILKIKYASSEKLGSATTPVDTLDHHSLHKPQEASTSASQRRARAQLPASAAWGNIARGLLPVYHNPTIALPCSAPAVDCWDFEGAGCPGSASLFQPRPSPFYVSALLRISFGGGRKGGSSSPQDQCLLLFGIRAAECCSSPYG